MECLGNSIDLRFFFKILHSFFTNNFYINILKILKGEEIMYLAKV